MLGDTLIYLGLWNILVFALYGIDKRRARQGQWRISEKTLLSLTLLGGGLGACLAGHYFRHKTRKWYFQLAWYTGLVLLLGLIIWIGGRG